MSALTVDTIFYQQAKDAPPLEILQKRRLHEWLTYDAQKDYSKNIFWSRVWCVTTYASLVAFVALAVVAFVFTMVYAEIYVPLTIAAIMLGGLDLSTAALKWMDQKSHAYAQSAKFAERILKELNSSSPIMDRLLSEFLFARDLRYCRAPDPISAETWIKETINNSNNPENLQLAYYLRDVMHLDEGGTADGPRCSIKSIVSRFEVYTQLKKEAETQSEKLTEKLEIQKKKDEKIKVDPRQISPAQSLEAYQAAQINLEKRQDLLQQAALYNLDLAYILNILQNPHEDKKQDAYYNLIKTPAIFHIIAGYHKNPHAHEMIITKNGRTFTCEQIRTMNPLKLAQEVFDLKLTEIIIEKKKSNWFW